MVLKFLIINIYFIGVVIFIINTNKMKHHKNKDKNKAIKSYKDAYFGIFIMTIGMGLFSIFSILLGQLIHFSKEVQIAIYAFVLSIIGVFISLYILYRQSMRRIKNSKSLKNSSKIARALHYGLVVLIVLLSLILIISIFVLHYSKDYQLCI